MTTAVPQAEHRPEIVVVGAGAVGLVTALALARSGRPVTLLGRPGPVRHGRTVALLQGSADVLRRLEVWPDLQEHTAPLKAMRIVDATGSLFTPLPSLFEATELGLPAFGYNIENGILEARLRAAAATTFGLTLIEADVTAYAFGAATATVTTDTGGTISAPLVIAADGRASLARKAAGIGVRTIDHPQWALTTVLSHTAPHAGISTEFHTRQGPFTLVPMPDAGEKRSSLVWVMAPAEAERRRGLAPDSFAREAETQCGRLLGRFTRESAIGAFPIVTQSATRLTGPRLLLVGEAAHALPPIGAQGLNLSFRDVATAESTLKGVSDPGADAVLQGYEQARRADVDVRTLGVNLLNRSLLTSGLGADLMRGAGLLALGRSGPLRRFAMRHGLAPGASRSLPSA